MEAPVEIGIGLPATIPWAKPSLNVAWAKRAEERGFSSLGIIDRIAYPNLEPLVTLAAAAAVTQRIRLMTTVLIAPTRRTGILAKQAASIDALSGGRLTLGLGIGGREDDFQDAPAPFKNRGKRFEAQLVALKQIWAGNPLPGARVPIGPKPVQPGGPPILLGGYSPSALERVGRFADGFISGGTAPDFARQLYSLAEQSWQAAGRPGKPRFVTSLYFGLGPDAAEEAANYIRDYYSFMGPAAENMARAIPSTPAALKAAIQGFEAIGADELIMWPCIPELDQVDLAADIAKMP